MAVESIYELDISNIRIDGGTQPRAELNYEVINDYAQQMQEGVHFPPVIVFYDGTDYWLADGFHRYHATKQLCKETIEAEVKQGTRRDAILHSVGANATHGLRRTNADKRRSVETLLRDSEWNNWSNREIARRCGVAESSVRNIRENFTAQFAQSEPHQPSGERTYITKHGTVATMNTSNIGRSLWPLTNDVSLQRSRTEDRWIQETEPSQHHAEPSEPREQERQEESQEWVGAQSESEQKARAYTALLKTRALDTWFEERGLDKNQPEAQESLRVFIEQNTEEENDKDDEEDLRYDGENAAYCKYCYKTHKKWRLDEDAWLCEFCYHCTPDEFMQIEDVEDSEDQKEFYRRHSVPTALLSSESNEWFTPSQYVEKARELMGSIDVDPASNAYANEKVVQAKIYYDIQTNGLDKLWHGRVWLNPPYGRDEGGSNQETWSRRLIEQYEAGITKEAVLLVNANTEAKWFQPLYNYLICFTNHRIRFYNTEGTPNQPTQGNAFIYFGNQPERFTELFGMFGVIVQRIDK